MTYNYPTEDGIKFAMEQGWPEEDARRGFDIVLRNSEYEDIDTCEGR